MSNIKIRARAKIEKIPNAYIIGEIQSSNKGPKFSNSPDNEFAGEFVIENSVQVSAGQEDISGREVFVGDKVVNSIDRSEVYTVRYLKAMGELHFGVRKEGIFMKILDFSEYELV